MAKEVTWGTPVAVTDYYEAFSESLATERDRFETRNLIGAYYEPDDSVGVERTQGDIVFAANPANMGHFLLGSIGQNTVASLGSGLFRNTFTPRQSDISSIHPMPSYTVEIFRAGTIVDSSFRYDGVQFASMNMNVQPNQDVRMSIGAIARRGLFIDNTVPTFPSSPVEPFLYDTTSVTLNAAANTKIENLTISLDNQLEGIATFNNSQYIGKVRRTGPPLVRVSGTIDFQDLTEYLDFQNQTERQLIVSFTKAASFQLILDIPRFVYTTVPVQASGRGRITSDFNGMARYHTGSATALDVQLTTTTTY